LISESFSNLADHVISFWVKKVLSKHSSHYDPYPSYKEVFRFEGPYFGTFKYCKVQFTVKFCTHRVLSKTNTKYEKVIYGGYTSFNRDAVGYIAFL
jgi:hypothetical protein